MSETVAGLPPWQNRWVRILVVALVMYIISMIDRTSISMAIPAMRAELGLGRAAIGFATGTFFFGYDTCWTSLFGMERQVGHLPAVDLLGRGFGRDRPGADGG
jgi:hypothetical protein